VIDGVGDAIGAMLGELDGMAPGAVRADRRSKYLQMGARGLAA
jgi:acetyl-CoA carboxylase carboxyl transferase subunit alpha